MHLTTFNKRILSDCSKVKSVAWVVALFRGSVSVSGKYKLCLTLIFLQNFRLHFIISFKATSSENLREQRNKHNCINFCIENLPEEQSDFLIKKEKT